MKRIIGTAAAVLIVGALVATGFGSTAGATTADRSSIGVVSGHYEGRDSMGHHIRFRVPHDGALRVSEFRINHADLGGAAIQVKDNKAFFTHDCNSQLLCAHGHWTDLDKVSGGWRQGHRTATYSAHWVEQWSGH